MNEKRAPDHLFEAMASGDEAVMFDARQEAMDWLLSQPMREGDRYVIPHPDTGDDMVVAYSPKDRLQ